MTPVSAVSESGTVGGVLSVSLSYTHRVPFREEGVTLPTLGVSRVVDGETDSSSTYPLMVTRGLPFCGCCCATSYTDCVRSEMERLVPHPSVTLSYSIEVPSVNRVCATCYTDCVGKERGESCSLLPLTQSSKSIASIS